MKKVCKNNDFCEIVMSSEKDNILEFNRYMKSDKMPYIIYADMESLITKTDGCVNNPENSSSAKLAEHIFFEYSMSTIWAFGHIENKHTLYHGNDRLKNFYESLREHSKNVIDIEKKKQNVTVNKRRTKIKSKCKKLLHLWKWNLKKAL